MFHVEHRKRSLKNQGSLFNGLQQRGIEVTGRGCIVGAMHLGLKRARTEIVFHSRAITKPRKIAKLAKGSCNP